MPPLQRDGDCWRCERPIIFISVRSANERWAFVVESPPRDKETHRRRVVARARFRAFVALMRLLDFRHIDLDTEARFLWNCDHAVDDRQRLLCQALSVLPDPVRIDRSD